MITVFTPTYNRCNLLNRLYQSLVSQNNKNFEWLIVDDGSCDDTKQTVDEWIKDNKITIRYIYQINSGKYVAFNNGVQNANGNLFFCVDSDDYLPFGAIETIYDVWSNTQLEDVSGIIALKSYTDGKIIGNKICNSIKAASAFELTYKYNCGGERSLVYRTDILKNNLFPVIDGEKFVTECVVYDRIDQNYKLLILNEVLTVCEYQADGLTSNIFKTMLSNPTGYKIFYNQRIDMALTFKQRLGFIIRYNAFCFMSKDDKYNYTGKHRVVVKLTKPLGWLAVKYYNIKKR